MLWDWHGWWVESNLFRYDYSMNTIKQYIEELCAYVGNISTTWAICALSKETTQQFIDTMNMHLAYDVDTDYSILELWPGGGNITQHLIQPNIDLTCIEVTPDFVEKLAEQYTAYDNVHIIQWCASDIIACIWSDVSMDAVVSTIPMTFLEKEWKIDEVLKGIKTVLKPHGYFFSAQIRSRQNTYFEKYFGNAIYEKRIGDWPAITLMTVYQNDDEE